MRESLERTRDWDEAQQDEYFRRSFDPDHLQVVEMEGENVGVLRVERRPDELFLHDIQILGSHQGKGLGSALIRDIQAEARERGLPVALRVLRESRARTLYEQLGFVITGEGAIDYLMAWWPR
jgi:GNAT superfamily N-acetyltransferase